VQRFVCQARAYAVRRSETERAAEASVHASRHVADVWQYRRETKAILTRTIAILSEPVSKLALIRFSGRKAINGLLFSAARRPGGKGCVRGAEPCPADDRSSAQRTGGLAARYRLAWNLAGSQEGATLTSTPA
jgi:hypothetical protein